MSYTEAKAQCKADGSFLAYPTSDAESAFLGSQWPTYEFWIGIDDIDEEGKFVSVDGFKYSYTKWANGEPNNWGQAGSKWVTEDAVAISGGNWRDRPATWHLPFVCTLGITTNHSKFLFQHIK